MCQLQLPDTRADVRASEVCIFVVVSYHKPLINGNDTQFVFFLFFCFVFSQIIDSGCVCEGEKRWCGGVGA